MSPKEYATTLYNSFFHKHSTILLISVDEVKEKISTVIADFKNQHEKEAFLLTMKTLFKDNIIDEIERQKLKFQTVLLNDSDSFIDIYDWLLNINLNNASIPHKPTEILTFQNWINNEQHVIYILNWLRNNNPKFINHKNEWIYKGQGTKAILGCLLYHVLHEKGYVKTDNAKEITIIAKNTFHIELTEKTVNNGRKKYNKYAFHFDGLKVVRK